MTTLLFQVPFTEIPDYRADAVVGNTIFEGLIEPKDVRRLHASILEIAFLTEAISSSRVVLLLVSPQLSESRLLTDWARAGSVIRPEIMNRLCMVIHRDDELPKIFGQLSREEEGYLTDIVGELKGHSPKSHRRSPEAFFEILRILMIYWLKGAGPISSKELCEKAGFTYPTIASALNRLKPHLVRHSDRKIELGSFPRDAWFKLVSQAEEVRSTQSYTDRSGRPRSPEKLMERLRELGRRDIAVGGISGARHYMPGLDLIGFPRLDFVLHAGNSAPSDNFIRRLDPALQPSETGEPAQIVVHTLYRTESFFLEGKDGTIWADPVECLLDLHEARLETQALEFLQQLTPRQRT